MVRNSPMVSNLLTKIVDNKHVEIKDRKKLKPLDSIKNGLVKSNRSLYLALSSEYSDFILECKKASPSKGLLRENFDLDEILSSYKRYASAISVLTDFTFFQGSFKYLEKVARTVEQPVLCKDFFIDSYQVYEARYHQADAILLMLSVLNDSEYETLAKTAAELNLDVLTEVHNKKEMQRALTLDAKIIGINNRNLKDLSIDLKTTEKLIDLVADKDKIGRLFISESGISSHADIKNLSSFVNGFLVGSSLMEKDNLTQQCKSLIYGKIKICGLSDNKTSLHAEKIGAS
jgi:indole-3-glycerol phosphate synthase/phosphoribosylanthranilate isomerase